MFSVCHCLPLHTPLITTLLTVIVNFMLWLFPICYEWLLQSLRLPLDAGFAQQNISFWLTFQFLYMMLQLLWHYHKQAVQLRIHYLATTKRGGESHSVLVTDIPGTSYGTMLGRALQVCSNCVARTLKYISGLGN